MQEMLLHDDDQLSPDLLLDKDIPLNAEFFKKQRHIQRQIVAQTAIMTPKQVELVRQLHTGLKIKDAAQNARYSAPGAYNFIKTAPAQRLLGLYRMLTSLNDGPTHQHRLHMLYQIARDNQEMEPRISISAIDTMNKMTDTYSQQQIPNNTINIQVNGQSLPRTALDQDAKTFKPVTIEQTKDV